ncbi:hypothetical protein J9T05_002826 [Salmonella enterica]|nr:hypothetical protein [Salmonella enterica]
MSPMASIKRGVCENNILSHFRQSINIKEKIKPVHKLKGEVKLLTSENINAMTVKISKHSDKFAVINEIFSQR